MVTVVLTSCGRPELLKRTLDSFFKFNTCPIERFVIVEDSAQPDKFQFLSEYPTVEVTHNEKNIGQIKSIVKAYATVTTPYIFHCEDDWEFFREGFIEQSMKILESDEKIFQVWIRGLHDTNQHPVEQTVINANGTPYRFLKVGYLGRWHGFSFNPGLRRTKDYVPYDTITKYEGKGNSGAEAEIGHYYFKKGFRAAIIAGNGFVRHIGWSQTTRNRAMIWNLDDAKEQHKHSKRLAAALGYILPKDKPVSDFGCGKGSYLAELVNKGFQCYGYEGTKGINEIADFKNIIECDLSKPFATTIKGSVLCFEVAEHIPKEFEATLIDNITNAADMFLIISWAVKGQGGFGHVNEQNENYVVPLIESKGFQYNAGLSNYLRNEGGAELWWFKKSIYVFTRK